MYVCVMDRQGKKFVHTNIRNNDFEFFLKLVEPYKQDLTVCCECMFGWYWLADACQEANLTFVLAHALYLKAIHGGKNKNDRIDSEKLAHLLRSNLIPPSYVYPADKRPLRALLRQRLFFVWSRGDLLARINSHQLAHNRVPPKRTCRTRDPWEEALLKAEDHPLRQLALKNEMAMIRHFDHQIFQLEEELQRQTKKVAGRDYTLLQGVPGIGESLGLTILYEIGDINRFPTVKDFLSYCRLVRGTVASAGRIKGLRGSKLGNPYLRWAFGEAAVIAPNAITRSSAPWPRGWRPGWAAISSKPTPSWPSNWPGRFTSCSRIKPFLTPSGSWPRWPRTEVMLSALAAGNPEA